MRNMFKFIILSLVLLLSVILTSAQDSQAIEYDEVVTGELDDETYEHFYTFEGQAGDTIFVRMSASSDEIRLDSFLILRDAQGNDLASDDDAAGNLNSLIGPYTLETSGTYTIVASRYQQENGTSEGSYELSVTIAEFETFSIGDKVRATLEDIETPLFYQFSAETDGFYEVQYRLVSGLGNADLSIRDEEGNYITSVSIGDYSPSSFVVVNLTAGETVTASLRYYGAYDENGAPVEDADPIEVGFSVEPIESEPLDTVENGSVSALGTLEDVSSVDYYAFTASNGQTLSINAEAANGGDFEVYVVLPTGTTAFYGGTYYVENDEIVPPQVVTYTGDYLLVVYRTSYSSEGNEENSVGYEVSLTLSSTPEIEANVAVEGVADNEQTYDDVYLYHGQAGEEITLTLTSLDDAYASSFAIELSAENLPGDENGFYVNFNSSQAGTISYNVSLPYDGIYIIRLYNGSYDSTEGSGAYRLLLESN